MNDDKKWRALKALFNPKTSALRSQVVHFRQMVNAVRRDMTPEQFLSTSSALALVQGKLSFATLVEARVHGMLDSDVDPALDDSNVDSSRPLGSGSVNTGNVVKPVGNYQLPLEPPPTIKENYKRQIVRRANIQSRSIFVRDLYGKIMTADWLS